MFQWQMTEFVAVMVWLNITYVLRPDFKLTRDSPYLTLTGELWAVYCEYFGENWPSYNETPLYFL